MLLSAAPIQTACRLRHQRLLPVKGTLLTRLGEKVHPADVIAEAQVPNRFIVLDVGESLGLSRAEAEVATVRQEGERVRAGDVIAEKGAMFSTILRAPLDGRIESTAGGKVILSTGSEPFRLTAGYPGTIVELHTDRGVTIETEGAWVYGEWGNGQSAEGQLITLWHAADGELSAESLQGELRGKIVVADWCNSPAALRQAQSLPLAGLALGSMSSALLPQAAALPFPLILLEGFGRIPVNEITRGLCLNMEGRTACIHAAFNPPLAEKPELILPRPITADTSADTPFFMPRQLVRVQGAPYAGKIGRIQRIVSSSPQASGGNLRQSGELYADVLIEHSTLAVIPLANLDIIE